MRAGGDLHGASLPRRDDAGAGYLSTALTRIRISVDGYCAAGWLTVEVEGKQDSTEQDLTRQRLARGLITAARSVAPRESISEKWRRALGTISSFSLAAGTSGVEVSIGVEPVSGRGDSGDPTVDLEELVADLVPALEESKIGLAIFVDEIQDLDPPR